MPEDDTQWRSFLQVLPESLNERFKVQLRRIALANGISVESWDADSKSAMSVGPRVMTMECLIVLCERSGDEVFRV